MRTHYLKTWQPYFDMMKNGTKTFDLRKNDRNFQVGDLVMLYEYDPEKNEPKHPALSDNILTFEITCVIKNVPHWGLMEGYAILQLQQIHEGRG